MADIFHDHLEVFNENGMTTYRQKSMYTYKTKIDAYLMYHWTVAVLYSFTTWWDSPV